jgi:hypothetical protein
MSINENQEFAAINQKTNERKVNAVVECHSTEEIQRSKKVKAQKRAIVRILAAVAIMLAAGIGIFGLEDIGWINATFRTVLLCVTGGTGMFKIGYFWREVEK